MVNGTGQAQCNCGSCGGRNAKAIFHQAPSIRTNLKALRCWVPGEANATRLPKTLDIAMAPCILPKCCMSLSRREFQACHSQIDQAMTCVVAWKVDSGLAMDGSTFTIKAVVELSGA